MFGYLYEKGLMKKNGKLFNFWCWLSFQRWYQICLIPMHIIKGYYYGYSTKEIYNFIKTIIKDKI